MVPEKILTKRQISYRSAPREQCPDCERSFCPGYLGQHWTRAHDRTQLARVDCPECGKTVDASYLQHHLARRHPAKPAL